jgi:hypothetical protein
MSELTAEYKRTFEAREFNHIATHSLVMIDEECLVGPVFPHLQSKDSPTIHVATSSAFVAAYLEALENDWNAASQIM